MPARSSSRRSGSPPRPTVAESGSGGRQPGWLEVLTVAGAVVVAVFAAAIITGFLPTWLQDVVFRTPVAIGVLIVGTGWLLWRISRREPGAPPR